MTTLNSSISKFVLISFLFSSVSAFAQQDAIPLKGADSQHPFQVIETIPEFEGCEGLKSNESRACFNSQIQKHIQKHLVYPKEALDQNIQGRVYVSFVINKEGKVTNISAKGPKILDNEASRIMKLLPMLKPGTQKGEPVNVSFTIPIVFRLDDPAPTIKK